MAAYYNEIEPYAAQWLRNLIKAGHIAPGDVDERSIVEVKPEDLKSYTQCHFFAGIGVWSHALRKAGWSDDRPVWTGSCPCQPFSVAGSRRGTEDERHLWPVWYCLIEKCKPTTVFGEQVASKDAHAWLDAVQTDMENSNYAFGACVAPAAGLGAPHSRHRLYFVANTEGDGWREECTEFGGRGGGSDPEGVEQRFECGGVGDLGNTQCESVRTDGFRSITGAEGKDSFGEKERKRIWSDASESSTTDGSMGNANGQGLEEWSSVSSYDGQEQPTTERTSGPIDTKPGPTNGHWRDADWLPCRDGKARAVEPGTFPLAHGATSRVGRLRAYGNAIVAPVAEAFVRSYMEVVDERRV